ncbi:MAG: hypothetical protein CM1200mP37_7820 [Chloroflexota bacterium]|nr:MAG: hypothetical protein CM1200mP37_7820 [Chloroflexota bacterium]
MPLPFSLDKDFVDKHQDIIRGDVLKVSLPEFSNNNIRGYIFQLISNIYLLLSATVLRINF